ncbi:MAG TPA: phosphodiester glycosidase family protein, partial [Phycisphaerae bacterium]|nr:phosphodiester glycosidase family protein [Phycisphaerae bacterium]
MRGRWIVLYALATALAWPTPALAQWTSVGTGIDYQLFSITGPNKVFVTRMDRANTNAFIESSIGQGRLSGGTEVVSSQFARYEDALGYWTQTWGTRNDAVVAINGSYFYFEDGIPFGGVVNSGWYAKRYDDVSGLSGFVWDVNRNATMGLCVSNPSDRQFITYANNNTQQFQGISVARGDNQLIIYTPQYDTTTLTDNTGSEVLVEMSTPFLIKPTPNFVSGIVRQIRQNAGSTQIPFDCIVLSAKGTAASTMLANVQVGDTIKVSQEIRHYVADCSTTRSGIDWTKAYAGISGNWVFLRDGVIQYGIDSTGERHPRTAIGFNSSYVFYLVVDGRQPSWSIGMTIDELAGFFKNTLDATWACNQDGGGSSTMVVNGTVMNSPSDGSQRAVANGMLMCNLVAKSQSTTFTTGQTVQTTGSANCRLGPGTNYTSIATIASGTQGTVQTHTLNGVAAKGSNWWKVTFPSATGWV